MKNCCDSVLQSEEQLTLPAPFEEGVVTPLPFILRYGPELDLMVYLPIGIAMAWCSNCNYPQYSKEREIPARLLNRLFNSTSACANNESCTVGTFPCCSTMGERLCHS